MNEDKILGFCQYEPVEDKIMIEALIDAVFDNGQYCEQMGVYLGFIHTTPCQIEFGEDEMVLTDLYGPFEAGLLKELNYRLLGFCESTFSVKVLHSDSDDCYHIQFTKTAL